MYCLSNRISPAEKHDRISELMDGRKEKSSMRMVYGGVVASCPIANRWLPGNVLYINHDCAITRVMYECAKEFDQNALL